MISLLQAQKLARADGFTINRRGSTDYWLKLVAETKPCGRCQFKAETVVKTRHFGHEYLCNPCAVNVRQDGQEVD